MGGRLRVGVLEWGMVAVLLLAGGCRGAVVEAGDGRFTATGSIQAQEVHLASEQGGRIETIYVEEGDVVRVGDLLVELDTTPYRVQLAQAEAAVRAAEAELARVKAGPRPEEVAAAQAALDLAEAQRDQARVEWEHALQVLDDPRALEAQIIDARTQMALAEQNVALAEAQLARERLLRDQKAEGTPEREAADRQVEAAEEALKAAQANLEAARTLVEQLEAIRERPLGYLAQAHAAEGQYRIAEAGVEVARARLEDLLAGPTPEEVAMAEAQLRQAQAQVEVLKVQIERCRLRSPIDGMVVAQVLQPGELAAPAATILTLADLRTVTLDVFVQEDRIGWVRLGQVVEVRVDALPGEVFEGQVVHVNDEPEFTPRSVSTEEDRVNTFYRVRVRLANLDGRLKPGMSAEAVFERVDG